MSMSPECRSFLRQLGDHVAAARAGSQPEHAMACPACAGRLQVACRWAERVARPPAIPARVRQPLFLEEIHERVVEESEQGAIGRNLLPHLALVPVPESIPWPGQELQPITLQRHLAESVALRPSWLWVRVRDQVMAERAARQRPLVFRRPFWVAAAASVLLVVLGQRLSTRKGTQDQPEIVFVTVTEMPSLQHPAAVLRQGTGG